MVLPDSVVLDDGVGELDDALGKLPAKDGGEGEERQRDAVLVHVGVVLQGSVHQADHHLELLVLQQHLVNEKHVKLKREIEFKS